MTNKTLSDPLEFNSAKLNQAFTETRKTFEKHREALDNMSSDIRDVEKFLQIHGIAISFYFEENRRMWIDHCHVLAWDQLDDGPFRLLVVKLEQPFSEFDPWVRSDERRPLIECPVPLRKAGYFRLSDFVRALSRYVQIYREPDPIPFTQEEIDEADALFGSGDEESDESGKVIGIKTTQSADEKKHVAF